MATRYWVGGSGVWDASDTTHWSATSGGSAGASAPTTSDDVVFNGSSGTGTVTISGGVCRKYTKSSGTLVSTSGTVDVYGDVSLGDGAGDIAMTPPVAGSTITSGGNFIQSLTLKGGAAAGYTVTASDALGINGALTMPSGTNAVYLLLKESLTHSVTSVVTAAASSGTSRIYSALGGTRSTLSDTSGTNTLTYLDCKDIAFTGGATWAQGTGFVDSGNNTGFTSSSASFDALFAQSLA